MSSLVSKIQKFRLKALLKALQKSASTSVSSLSQCLAVFTVKNCLLICSRNLALLPFVHTVPCHTAVCIVHEFGSVASAATSTGSVLQLLSLLQANRASFYSCSMHITFFSTQIICGHILVYFSECLLSIVSPQH